MKLLIILLLISSYSFGQTDSVRLKVTKARSDNDKTYYWLKNMETKENYFTICECYQRHFKGEIVMIKRDDLIFITPFIKPKNY